MFPDVLLTLENWDRSPLVQKEAAVALVQRALDRHLRYVQLETHALGDQEHTIAVFEADSIAFVLLPGYEGALGYDPERHVLPEPPPDSGSVSARDYLPTVLTPRRRVTLPPFLMERTAEPLAVWLHKPDDTRTLAGPIRRADAVERVAREGFRLPSSDEWEHACSGSARTFFRWGDEWPPIEWTASFRRGPDEWREDLKPNAFGLHIAQDPSHLEYCAEPDVLRGGDGGQAAGADAGWFYEWLPFASCYRFPFRQRNIDEMWSPLIYLRRAITLPTSIT